MTFGYRGNLKGQPGPAHVAILQKPVSTVVGTGTGYDAPLTGPRCHDRTEYTTETRKVPLSASVKNKRLRERRKADNPNWVRGESQKAEE